MRSVEDSGNRLAKKAKLADQTVTLGSEAGPRIPARVPTAGETFADRYEILEKLGEGGVGTVYKARHLHLDTILAIKILQSTHLKDQDSVARFCREGKLISKLNHTNIVKVQEFGVWEGCPYMTMDYIDGIPISKMIKDPDVSTDRWIGIFRQVLDALAHAHERGIVHRDIKPGNILFRVDEVGEPTATVVDFGLAKATDSQEQMTESAALTRTGDLFGTPLYMSPEQCTGNRIDSRCDIYSLGCVMYHCLTGTPPFQGQSNFELVYRQINSSPANFSADLRKRGISADIESIVLKAMAKQESSRYQYAQQMSIDLLNAQARKHGVVSQLAASMRLVTGRFKASERAAIFRTTALMIAILNAMVTATLLFALPSRMKEENESMIKYASVVSVLNKFLAENQNIISNPEYLEPLKADLLKLTHEDDELKPMGEEHVELVNIAVNDTEKGFQKIRRQLIQEPFSILNGSGKIILAKTAQSWIHCSASNARMTAKATELFHRNQFDLQQKYNLYRFLPVYGVISSFALAWLIVLSFKTRSREGKRLQAQSKAIILQSKLPEESLD